MLFYIEPSNIFQAIFPGIDHSLEGYNQQEPMKPLIQAISAQNNIHMVDHMLPNPPPSLPLPSNFCHSNSFNKLCSSDAMQYVESDPNLALNQAKSCEEDTAIKFNKEGFKGLFRSSFHGEYVEKSKRKRVRTTKTREEVECQRMTHITVERNRRKQMNEHLRVLRSLMPTSYVQRGDQASIVGGAIEFVRELEQLLQCLESQKRQRIHGDEHEIGLQEETAESKSCSAEVEVKLTGFDGLIKILSRKRPCLLIKTIAALDDLHLHILHVNVTTIEQSVLCSFTVKMSVEARLRAQDIADSIQQMLSHIHADSSTMCSNTLS